jgi:hypothetical protein
LTSRAGWVATIFNGLGPAAGARGRLFRRGIGEAALRPVSLVCGAGGDRAPSRAALHHTGVARRLGRAPSTISRELRRNAATRNGGLEYRATTAQWHAERAARRPKQAKLALNAALQAYVEERLAGVVIAPSGAPVPGPAVSWKGRRHGPRQDRRWATAWSPEQIARRLPVDFPDDETMRISLTRSRKAAPYDASRSRSR